MSNDAISVLADAWIAYWKAPKKSTEREALSWVIDREWELVRESPLEAWQLILAILAKDQLNAVQEVLSAGPLEDLLAKHGEAVIGVVEAEARSNPVFARLLGGVWQNAMSEAVWVRVQGVWDRRAWDGLPAA